MRYLTSERNEFSHGYSSLSGSVALRRRSVNVRRRAVRELLCCNSSHAHDRRTLSIAGKFLLGRPKKSESPETVPPVATRRGELAGCNCIKLAVTRACINHSCGPRRTAGVTHARTHARTHTRAHSRMEYSRKDSVLRHSIHRVSHDSHEAVAPGYSGTPVCRGKRD